MDEEGIVVSSPVRDHHDFTGTCWGAGEDLVQAVTERIQAHVFPSRIRTREFFQDYDPLKSGRCTRDQFHRALDAMGVRASEEEVRALGDHYHVVGARVQKPQVIAYDKFCEKVDEVFSTTKPDQARRSPRSLDASLKNGHTLCEKEEQQMEALRRVAMLCRTRGVTMKTCYEDIVRGTHSSPSSGNPRRSGKVSINQFVRHFPFKKEVTQEELGLIVELYTTKEGDFHYGALHDDVAEVMNSGPQPYPRSDLVVRPDEAEWSHQDLDPVDKILAKVVEKRVRLYEFFQDFDALRKGFCTSGQVKTVFTVMNLEKLLLKAEMDQLLERYTRGDGMFGYAEFCKDVDSAFTTPGLERDPLKRVTMPGASTTAPARRNRMRTTQGSRELVKDLEEKIRARVRGGT
jgi:Ca2+-binding EF-hand superfamily protein